MPVRSRFAVNTADAAIAAAVAGTGITRVLSYQVAEAVADGKLLLLLQSFEPEPLPVHLVYPAQLARATSSTASARSPSEIVIR
ncbi:hypothetical protein KZX46_08530 [Polymorphobacter sp. PAMC 29334]|nr:hypothetical protein KZX46_08530 [Polymorphobacter sp. PAMC 29334]